MGFYSKAKKILGKMDSQGDRYAKMAETAERLPFQLKEEFRKRQDPAMNKAIRSAEQNVLGGAIEGLNKYQNIQNPFARRDLAEKYQGSLSKTYTSLTDERQRRTGVIQDYISLWSGTYGAMAKGEQIKLSNLSSQFSGAMQIGGAEQSQFNTDRAFNQSQSNWERQFARSGRNGGGGKGGNGTLKNKDTIKMINELKRAGKNWEEIQEYAASNLGVDISQGGFFDVQMNTAFKTGIYPQKPKQYKETERTPQQQHQDRYYSILNDIEKSGKGATYDDEGNLIVSPEKGWWLWKKEAKKIAKPK